MFANLSLFSWITCITLCITYFFSISRQQNVDNFTHFSTKLSIIRQNAPKIVQSANNIFPITTFTSLFFSQQNSLMNTLHSLHKPIHEMPNVCFKISCVAVRKHDFVVWFCECMWKSWRATNQDWKSLSGRNSSKALSDWGQNQK